MGNLQNISKFSESDELILLGIFMFVVAIIGVALYFWFKTEIIL